MTSNIRKLSTMIISICLLSAGCSDANSTHNNDTSIASATDRIETELDNDKETPGSLPQSSDYSTEEQYTIEDDLSEDSFETEIETEDLSSDIDWDEYDEHSIYNYYTPFVNGAAWVNISSSKTHPVIINKDGIVVFDIIDALFEKKELFYPSRYRFQCLKNGTVCYFNNLLSTPQVFIIDSNGNVLFNSENNGENSKFYFCTYVNDLIIMIEKDADFYSSGYYICEFNDHGELISKQEIEIDPSLLDQDPYFAFEYVNDGYFIVGEYSILDRWEYYDLYNQRTNNFIDLNGKNVWGSVVSDEMRMKGVDYRGSVFKVLDIRDDVVVGTLGCGLFKIVLDDDIITSISLLGYVDKTDSLYASEGIINYTADKQSSSDYLVAGLYNYDGDLLFKYSDLSIIDSEPFFEGKALLIVKGADGEKYVTYINDSGEFLFEPIKIDKYIFPSYKGNLKVKIKGEEKVITEDGVVDDITSLHKYDSIVTVGDTILSDGYSISTKNYISIVSMPDCSKPIGGIADKAHTDGFESTDGYVINKAYYKK